MKIGRVKFESRLPEVEFASELQIAQALEELGLRGEMYAKLFCPVDTGRLRNSITHQINAPNKTMVLGTNVEYATHVEFGHMKRGGNGQVAPRKFISPAMEDVERIAENVIKKYLKK